MKPKHRFPALFTSCLLACTVCSSCSANRRAPSARQREAWFAVGVQQVTADEDNFDLIGISDEPGLALDGGLVVHRTADLEVGVEALAQYSKHDFVAVSGYENATNLSLGAGLRLTPTRPWGGLAPFVRAGLLYQYVYEDVVDDDGVGLYAGLGFDAAVAPGLTFGPSLTYSVVEVDRAQITQLSYGVRLGWSF